MPVLSGTLQAEGALVEVLLGWSDAAVQAQRLALRPVPPSVQVQALVDTGAEVSCADPSLIRMLGLPLHSVTLANLPAAGGVTWSMQYEANLTIEHPAGQASLNLLMRNMLVVEVPLRSLGYQVLVGRDVLALCDFLYSGRAGTFTLTY
jgi:hypothetical protein